MQNIKTKFTEKINITKEKVNFYKNFIVKNFKHISTFLFVTGFILDYFTLPNVTNIISIYIGGTLFLIIGLLIYFREYLETDNLNFKEEDKYVTYLSLAISFLLGSFASFVFVYYIRGGDIISNIPILTLILFLMLSNEFVKNKFRLYIDLATYTLTSIFYFIFAVPYILKSINDFTFILSIVISTFILYFYLIEIYKVNVEILKVKIQNYIFIPIILICTTYFSNIFPAVPLSLNYSSLYKKITVQTNELSKQKEYVRESQIGRNILFKRVVNKNENNIIYYYSELQAPSSLTTKVSHVWEYYDERNNKWITTNNISFNIKGGREDGYRAYSYITNLNVGDYRVKVLVDDKRLAGKIKFEVR